MAKPKADLAGRLSTGYFTKTEEQESVLTAKQEPSEEPKKPGTKRTFYLGNDVIAHLRTVQMERFKRTGKQPLLSDLVAEAILMLPETQQAS